MFLSCFNLFIIYKKKYIPYSTSTLIGIFNSLITALTLWVPTVILYAYLMHWPLYEGGALLGIVSRYISKIKMKLKDATELFHALHYIKLLLHI